MQIILFGPPGVGKGTQAKLISKKFKIKHISTGDILREEIVQGTEMGLKAKAVMDGGNLVSDEIMIGIIKKVIKSDRCKNGFILDGFPRTVVQAEALTKLFAELNTKLSAVIYMDVDDKEIIQRLGSRYSCSKCVKIFSRRDEIVGNENCPDCGEKLIQRDDDKPETVLKRLWVYKESTAPVKTYYEKLGNLLLIDGSKNIKAVNKNILAFLKE
jgi:adenylate kinase